MWNLIAAIALAVVAPADVTATKLDGTVVSGRLQAWSGGEVVLTTTAGPQSIPAAELLTLDFPQLQPAAGDTGNPRLELTDGSILPLTQYAATGRRAGGQLQPPPPAEPQRLAVPLDKVRAVRLQPIDAEVLPQWQEIRRLGVPSDLLVVSKRDGKSLDHLECVLGDVTDKEVVCELDGKEVRVPRSKVAGLIYFRSHETPDDVPSSVVVGPSGLRIAAKTLRWEGDRLIASTNAGFTVAWPLAGISSVDLSAGKILILSDLEPVAQSWHPLIGLPTVAARAAKYGAPRFNQSASGGPLTLAFPDPDQALGSPQLKTFAKGLAVRSRTELVYRLPAGYSRLLAKAGIDPAVAASGNVMLSVFGDDRLLVEQAIDGRDAPLPLDLDVAGVKRLKIVVDYGENLDTGDWLNLCNVRLAK